MNRLVVAFALLIFELYPSELMALDSYQNQLTNLYDSGRFDEVTKVIESKISTEPKKADAFDFYVLGNAYFKLNKLGNAMAAYLKAQELAPRSQEVAFNVMQVSSRRADQLSDNWPESNLKKQFMLYRLLSGKELLYFGALCIGLAGIAISAYLGFVRFKRVYLFLIFVCLTFGVYVFGVLFIGGRYWPRWGAITQNQTGVYSAPSTESGVVLFKLNDGAPLIIEGATQRWTKITLSDGKKGWVESAKLVTYFN